jgi:GNAT superfamily N-acetyltransferase
MAVLSLTFKPLEKETWPAFVKLFGERGACGGCWCMAWRLGKAEFDAGKGGENKGSIQKLARSREPVGILAFFADEPVGWCAVAPREKYIRLERSRSLKPVDDEKVWSVSCFFIQKSFRRKGISVKLLKAVIDYASSLGAKIVEAYPVDPKKDLPDVFLWTGLLASFKKAGFQEMKRNSPARPIVRFYI